MPLAATQVKRNLYGFNPIYTLAMRSCPFVR